MSVLIFKKPVLVEFDRRRQVVFNLNTEILIRNAGGDNSSLWTTIGERTNPETGKVERTLDVNLENLRLYLWAALQDDAKAHGESLTVEEVGGLLTRRKWVILAVEAITEALRQYYGDDTTGSPATGPGRGGGAAGEVAAPAASV
jgi:hypothetical protein